jgi:hypothetical protein
MNTKNTPEEGRQIQVLPLRELAHKLNSVHVDPTFQRRVCWSLEQKQRYIVNILKQHEAGSFAFADIESGLERSKEESDASSIEKYKKASNHLGRKSLISLDAQNRGQAIHEFYNDKFGITVTLKVYGSTFTMEDTKYSDLPVKMEARLDHSQMIVVVFNRFPYGHLSKIFLSINDGLPLVPQEKRNAQNSWLSTELLDKSEKKYKALLERVVTPDAISRMGDTEIFLKVFVATHKNFPWRTTDDRTLDKMYAQGDSKQRQDVPDYHQDHTNRFYRIMDMTQSILAKPQHPNHQTKQGALPNHMFWATVLIAESLIDNRRKFQLGQEAGLDTEIRLLDKDLNDEGAANYAASLQLYNSKLKTNPSSVDELDEPSASDYYNKWRGLPHQKGPLTKRKAALTAEFFKRHSVLLQPDIHEVQPQEAHPVS